VAELPAMDVSGQPAAGVNFGRYHALVIGNDRYQHIQPLRSAVRDARCLEAILRADYGFQTSLLVDATRDQILGALTDYRRRLGPGDNLVVYYAGHGWVDKDEDEGYWLPVDAQADDPVRWLSNATLTSTIRAMRAKHILVIADSCLSGKLTRGVNPIRREVALHAQQFPEYGDIRQAGHDGGDFLFVREPRK
jgi:uncharacterized caspase-like protein